jgi:hypothetical protein
MAPLEETSDLQAQVDQLSSSLRQRPQTPDELQPVEQQLSELTQRCAEILGRWSDIERRHSHAVTEVEERLSEWSAIENRLQQDSLQRMRELERTIGHEWKAIRQIHEEPVKQLREQAAALGETCVAAANLALRSFERAEARISALETTLQGRLSALSEEVHAALAELHRQVPAQGVLGSPVAPFPLEGVVRIHDELREAHPAEERPAALAHVGRPEVLEHDAVGGPVPGEPREREEEEPNTGRFRGLAIVMSVIGVVAFVILGIRLQQNVNDASARVAAAERQAQITTDAANRQIAESRAEAQKQIAAARETARQAQIVGNVLAAPDLTRFNLVAPDQTSAAYAQVLWSRSRGLVLSASRLPSLQAGTTYQAWFLTNGDPVSAGAFTPDSEGRATLALDTPPNLQRPVTGVVVTAERTPGQTVPGGETVLRRLTPASAAPPAVAPVATSPAQ